jgi:hypothetical protein
MHILKCMSRKSGAAQAGYMNCDCKTEGIRVPGVKHHIRGQPSLCTLWLRLW